MNFYKQLENIFPHLLSIRKLENYVSIDVEFPTTWKLPKKYVDEKTVLEQKSQKPDFRCFSFATEFNETSLNHLLDNLLNIVKYNREREEKEKLFENKVQELKSFFDRQNLNDLKALEFIIKNDYKLEFEEDEQGEDTELVPKGN